ncbi:G-rich sequence factor 1-like isoform X1 [Carassius gibelio]|uniref:G-rich sequence factor 1-like isoform X1 n=1 Tax=Carassius gibelio TaxID=101364 RepID=UPI002279B487|nr:G-rich sequence factor 1-like isoform X1 [Carassius gibelio]
MSVLSRSALLLSLVRCVRRHQQFPCVHSRSQTKTAQFTAARGRDVHSWSARCLADRQVQHPWTIYQRTLFTEAPSKEDEYPPVPKYTPDEEPHSKEVFIIQARGFPYSCTAEDLMNFFSDCRIRGGVEGIHIIHNRNGRSTGRAFIELEHEEDICKALDLHKHYLGQRFVEVYEVTKKDAEAILNTKQQFTESDEVVRLRGLPFSCTEEDIIQFFSGLEIVEDGVTIVLNRKGRNSGDAFVHFATKEMAEKALKKDREVMGNRYIEIYPSRKNEFQVLYGRGRNETPAFTPGAEDAPRTMKTANSSSISATENLIHMRGLPYEATGEDIVKFFAPTRLVKVLVEYGPDGRPTGGADAYFRTHQDAVLAMSKDREYIMKRYIKLFLNSSPSGDEQ